MTALPEAAPVRPRFLGRPITPLTERRLALFRANKRGFWAMWIFLTLFVVSLFANFIANDRPILVSYKGELLYPLFVDYPEEKFGGFLPVTDYRDPVTAKEIAAHGWALWPTIRFSYDTHDLDVPTPVPSAPTWLVADGHVPGAPGLVVVRCTRPFAGRDGSSLERRFPRPGK